MHLLKPDDPRLYEKAAPVTDIAAQVLPILDDLRLAMAKAPDSVALSAPQVGVGLRFFITNGKHLPSVVINPVILEVSPETQVDREGCLTWPGKWKDVSRAYSVKVRFLNVKGMQRNDTFSGFAARIFQHENDHLDGKCIFPRPTADVSP